MPEQQVVTTLQPTNLADLLERLLDKGIVIAGDIKINLADVELLTIKIRLLIASVERAKAMGINWWESDIDLSGSAKAIEEENKLLKERLAQIEKKLAFNEKKTKK